MKQYQQLLTDVLTNGIEKNDRTGTGTKALFGYQMRFNLQDGFPLVTTKKVHFKSIVHELLWFISGDTNIQYLVQNGVNIWNDWPYKRYLQENGGKGNKGYFTMSEFANEIATNDAFAAKWGNLGPIYGKQWRDFNGIDQLKTVIEQIKTDPNSRRMIVSAWNPSEIEEMSKAGLPPCHTMFQFSVTRGKLSCQLYQRSADVFLGVPFNIASYALLTKMVAHECGLEVGEFIHTLGDAHIYKTHVQQAQLQITREPAQLPAVKLNQAVKSVFDFKYEDIELFGYNPHPSIKAKVAV